MFRPSSHSLPPSAPRTGQWRCALRGLRAVMVAMAVCPWPIMGAHAGPDRGATVILAQHPGTELDRQAHLLQAQDLGDAHARGEHPVVLTASGPLSDHPGDMALFVQLQSPSLCGSAGCSTSVFLRRGTRWTQVLDSLSGPVRIMPQAHGGMHDLVVDDGDRWIWNGTTYADTQAASAPSATAQ
ncbi:MAG: hypothetical protein ABF714_13595 [Novacetimonas hansenii]|uniref:hypothetical protein n=1 Tax=Novacetimonas hansenii TaxID=436 RepID=UPI0039EB54A2